MSSDQQSQAADALPGEEPSAAPSAVPPQPGAATTSNPSRAARAWRWRIPLLLALIVVVIAGLYSTLPPTAEPEKKVPSAYKTPPAEPSSQPSGKIATDSQPQDRLPLDPLLPENGAKQIAEARRVADYLAERFPQNPDAQEMPARFHFELADIDEAVAAWNRCLALNANYVYAHVGLAKVASQRGELNEAVAHWRRAVLADPGALAHQIELGKALLAAGQVDEAIVVLEGVVKADPASPQSYSELGAAQLQKRDDAAAKVSFEVALQLDSNYAAAHIGLATVCARLDLIQQAREHEAKHGALQGNRKQEVRGQRLAYDDDRALGEDIARLYTDMGSVFLAEGRAAPAEQLWRRAARLHAENRQSRQALAWLLREQNKPLESILLLRELARLEPESVAYPAEIARLYGEMGRFEDAQRALEEFADAAPASSAAQRVLAEYYLGVKNEPGSAIKHAQKAAEISGAASDWVLLSAAHERAGDLAPAIAALEQASGRAPDNLQYRQLLELLKDRAAGKKTGPPGQSEPPQSNRDASAAGQAPGNR